MVNLVVCSAAEGDYAKALRWYAERSVQAADRFETEFGKALESIASDPHRFPMCDASHRYYLMRHYPFQVIFREHGGGIVVIAVAHTTRRAGYWADR